jgi:acetolactate synthase-1/2/3 large subunit
MAILSGGQVVALMLRDYGVRYVFGLPRGQTYPIYLGIHELEPAIKHVHFHCERCAAMAADAFARVTGQPGVCDATVGPGVTNLVSGVGEAFGASSPLIAITSDIHTWMIGKNANQESDNVSVLKPFTKASFHVNRTDKIPDIVRMAFRIATCGRPGPVSINFPADILEARMDFGDNLYVEPTYDRVPSQRVAPDPSAITAAVEVIVKAECPVIYSGGGAILSRAFQEVRQLAELLAAPVATSIMGKGSISEDHPLSIGTSSTVYNPDPIFLSRAPGLVSDADLLILIGHRTDQYSTADWLIPRRGQQLVHIDIDPKEIGRNYPVAAGVVGDAKLALHALVEALQRRMPERDWSKLPRTYEIQKATRAWSNALAPETTSNEIPITAPRLINEISEFADKNAIFVVDAGLSSFWGATFFKTHSTGRVFLAPRGLAGIGNGLPLAIGAKLAEPEREVIGFGGDGAFILSLHELATMKQEGINAIYVVSNNESYGYGRKIYESLGIPVISHQVGQVNYADVAKAFGCFGLRVERPEDIRPALEAARRSGRPAVIEVLTAVELPPTAAGLLVRQEAKTVAA